MTCGTTPWARMITVPDAASSRVSARADAGLGKLAYHDGVMDERTQRVDLCVLPCLRRGRQCHIERTLHAVAGAGVGGDLDGRRGLPGRT